MTTNRSLATKTQKITIFLIILLILSILFYKLLYPLIFESYTGVVNVELSYENSVKLSDSEFEALANELTYQSCCEKAAEIVGTEENDFSRQIKINLLMNTPSFRQLTDFKHIEYFRDAGIRQYEGPKTCLQCHPTMKLHHADGTTTKVNTLDDVVNSVHFKFQTSASGFSTYGYDGRQVNFGDRHSIPVGKINRACGIPGSFSWTGWAELIKSKPAHGKIEIRSEGCG